MPRIEEVQRGVFVKVINPTEAELINYIADEQQSRTEALSLLATELSNLSSIVAQCIDIQSRTINGARMQPGSIRSAAINPEDEFRLNALRIDSTLTMNGTWQGSAAPYTKTEIDNILNAYVKK